jgi:hypothetical protein
MAAVRDFFEAYRGHILTGAVAAAAGAAVAYFAAKETRIIHVKDNVDQVAAVRHNTEVESLEVPSGSGTIFTIPSEDKDEPATTVIWVQSDDAPGPGNDAPPPPEGPI